VIMVEWHGYGRAYPPGRRQIVGALFHLADREPYRRLNDVVCVCTGEVRTPSDPGQAEPDLDHGWIPEQQWRAGRSRVYNLARVHKQESVLIGPLKDDAR
jgi:hypothetical protein